jgi:hypothetical protein
MRALWIVMLCATGIVGALLIFSRTGPRDRTGRTEVADQVAALEQVTALEQEVRALRGRVGAAEAIGATALARASAPTVMATVASSADDREHVPEGAPPTPERQAKTFKVYFDQLDQLRGAAGDAAAAKKLDDALSTDEWKASAPKGPLTKSVACGNGYCRVSLAFKEAGDAMDARGRLAATMMTLASGLSIYFDPANLHVEGYFALDGKTLPPFPSTES